MLLLTNALPKLAVELRDLLAKKGRPELASQVPALKIVDRCRCGDDFCASFYTQPKPAASYGPNLECLELEPAEGRLILDVTDGVIAHVECLYRESDRKTLLCLLP